MARTRLFNDDRTAIYIRASNQADTHRKQLQEYCDANGWTVDEEFLDDDISVKTTDRPEFHVIRRFAHSGIIKRIIAIRLDHITHNINAFVAWVNELNEYGCRLIVLEDQFDTDTPRSQYALTILKAMAGVEDSQAQERRMETRRKKARKGGNTGKPAPFGYRFVDGEYKDGQYIVDDEQAEIVRNVFNDYVSNDALSMAAIARNLNEQGLTTSRGGKWQTATVRYILRNPFYAGLVQYENTETEGKHEAIISVELYRKAQAKVMQTAKPRKR